MPRKKQTASSPLIEPTHFGTMAKQSSAGSPGVNVERACDACALAGTGCAPVCRHNTVRLFSKTIPDCRRRPRAIRTLDDRRKRASWAGLGVARFQPRTESWRGTACGCSTQAKHLDHERRVHGDMRGNGMVGPQMHPRIAGPEGEKCLDQPRRHKGQQHEE
jgi:hypothetical protein